MINQTQLQPRLLKPGAGPMLSFLGVNLSFKVESADTAAAIAEAGCRPCPRRDG